MIQVKNLTLTHRKDLRDLTENFSFVIGDGDKAAIIGEDAHLAERIAERLRRLPRRLRLDARVPEE